MGNMWQRVLVPVALIACVAVGLTRSAQSAEVAEVARLDTVTAARCLKILRGAVRSDEFWPSMHAAEALTLTGHGDEVVTLLTPLLPLEKDDQKRCGLARELVRAGQRQHVNVLLSIMAGDDAYGHVHSCESIYKVFEIGDGVALRAAIQPGNPIKKQLMAAAALGRWGHPQAMKILRGAVSSKDPDEARIAAWVLARIGDATDIPLLRKNIARFDDPLVVAYFENSMATLGDTAGLQAMAKMLQSDDSALQVYAATFAGDARAVSLAPLLLPLLEHEVLDVRVRGAQTLLVLSKPNTALGNDQIVIQDVFAATAKNPRYSEGSIVALADGRLLFATTEFADSASDFANARIIGRTSKDGGVTWDAAQVLQKSVGKLNVMSVTLLRLTDAGPYSGPIGMFYLVKNAHDDLDVWLKVSTDEGKTFGESVLVTNQPGYHVMNNDRVQRLSTGRLVVPVASTADVSKVNHFVARCFLSDDQGLTWRLGQGAIDYAQRGAMEPEIVELATSEDGRVRLAMYIRTQLGHIAVGYSHDAGETWTKAVDAKIRAPEAPATIRRVPSTGDLVLVWNDNFTAGAGHGGKRTPLSIAISKDDGKTWQKVGDIETSKQHTYAYTSLCFVRGRMVMSYYVRDESTGRISNRFRSLPISWLYN
ncbi:MAG TPA: sialidase [Planctomycetes bacterium]|nr:sialidase [Planctomycetaceae bacterium]HIN54224.1 sialidase [Planctomycetota bacterium]